MIKIYGIDEEINSFYCLFLSLIVLFLCGQSPNVHAAEKKVIKEKIVIISPYPTKFINGFRRAFEYHHPEYAIQVHKMKTKEGVDYLKQKKGENTVDLFWATSIDAYELLKADDLLASYKPAIQGIPPKIAGIPVADPNHLYSGFAFTGVGLMWNIHYLKSNGVDAPKNWVDLIQPKYAGLIGMSSPVRSGTTHIAVESILQTHGWDKGWQLLQQIGSNVRKITKKSSHVPEGVKNGQFGVGIVVDYYGLSAKAKHFPVNFTYTEPAIMFPASIALIKDAPHAGAAKLFIDFLLSLEGQHLLLNKEIARLPIRMESYEGAPDDYPNPFKKTAEGEAFVLDFSLSKSRYALVNILFDSLITLNLEPLKAVHKRIHQLEKKLAKQSNTKASALLQQAKQALYQPLVSEKQALETAYNTKFEAKDALKQQLEAWSSEVKERYQEALVLVEEGLAL